MCGTAAAASALFTVTRTISEPARASAATCCTVAAMSAVSVLVIDCTTIGASPPIGTCRPRPCNARGAARGRIPESTSFELSAARRRLRVAGKIDRLVVVSEPHAARVADHQRQRRLAVHALFGPPRFSFEKIALPLRSRISTQDSWSKTMRTSRSPRLGRRFLQRPAARCRRARCRRSRRRRGRAWPALQVADAGCARPARSAGVQAAAIGAAARRPSSCPAVGGSLKQNSYAASAATAAAIAAAYSGQRRGATVGNGISWDGGAGGRGSWCGRLFARRVHQRLRVELHEPRIVADEPAHEHGSRQPLVRACLERFDLVHGELQLARDVGDAQVLRLRAAREQLPGAPLNSSGRLRFRIRSTVSTSCPAPL